MKKNILIVDDSKTVIKTIQSLIPEEFEYEPYYAETSLEAIELMRDHTFFAAILDRELPDSRNGELIDFVLNKQIHTIVLTAIFNESSREMILKKPIVDYIVKNSLEDISHALDVAQNLLYFDKKIAMVVDDSRLARMQLRQFFEALAFHVVEAPDGHRAMELLDKLSHVDVMSIDYHMPGLDGIELIQKIRNKTSFEQPLIFAISSSDSALDRAKLIKSGANEFFTKPVHKEEFNHKLENFFEILNQKDKLMRSQTLLKNEQNKHSAYMRTLFEKNPNIIVVVNSEELLDANEKFYEYFPQFETINDFKEQYGCISYFFENIDEENFLRKGAKNWIQEALVNELVQVHVKNGDKLYYMNVKADVIDVYGEIRHIITFTDVTQNYLLQKKFEEYSIVDELTQINNRRFFNIVFEKEISRSKRDKKLFTFLMIDVDNFKLYNDFYGHYAGDIVLSSIATAMQKYLKRSSDYLFRLGGEEFGMLFLESTQEESMAYADVIRKSVEELNIVHEENHPYGLITVSIGLYNIDFSKSKCDGNYIYKKADEALYQAKNDGRNRVSL